MNGKTIEYIDKMRYHGVILDSKLSWNAHISDRVKKAEVYLHQISTSIGKNLGSFPFQDAMDFDGCNPSSNLLCQTRMEPATYQDTKDKA